MVLNGYKSQNLIKTPKKKYHEDSDAGHFLELDEEYSKLYLILVSLI